MSEKAKKDDESGITENQVLSKLEAMEKKVNERVQRLESSLATVQSQISNKLESIERKINVRIDNVESSLKKIEESSILSTDDQLFFGFVFSIALLILTIPNFDIGTLFESFGVTIEATKGFITTKHVTVASLIIACATRYLVVFAENVKRNKFRAVSVGCLVGAVHILMLDFFIRGLSYAFNNVDVFLLPFAPFFFVLFALLFGYYVEKKWYQHYGFNEPLISISFAFVGVFVLVSYVLGTIVYMFIPSSTTVTILIMSASMIITLLMFMLSIRVNERLRHTRGKDS